MVPPTMIKNTITNLEDKSLLEGSYILHHYLSRIRNINYKFDPFNNDLFSKFVIVFFIIVGGTMLISDYST